MKEKIGNGTNPIMGVGYRQNPVVLKRTDGKERSENEAYDKFIRTGRNIFFTDEQLDFLWDYMEWWSNQK